MILVLTQASEDYARAMSHAMWALARPDGGDTTAYAVGWFSHPSTGEVALDIDSYSQRIDPQADIEGFVSLLPILAAERITLAATLEAHRGREILALDWLPVSLRSHLLTDEDAAAAGWFG